MRTLLARLRVGAARRLNILSIRLRHLLSPAYVVIYDLDDGHEQRKEWYGYFSSPEEACRVWTEEFGKSKILGNPELAIVLRRLPGRRIELWHGHHLGPHDPA